MMTLHATNFLSKIILAAYLLLSATTYVIALNFATSSTALRSGLSIGAPLLLSTVRWASASSEIGILSSASLLTEFLTDARGLGAVRFVVVGQGAILETAGSFDNLRYADTVKGRLATISSENPCFECHIRLNEVKEVKNVIVEKFEKILRVTRFLGKTHDLFLLSIQTFFSPDTQITLSVMLTNVNIISLMIVITSRCRR